MKIATVTVAALLLGLAQSQANAQQVTRGELEYLDSCAVCHGLEGKGDGPLADELQRRPADLTVISRETGRFPYWRVFAIIDGRYIVPGHGEREMPVWGQQFIEGDVKTYGPSGGAIVTQERIHELTGYVESLQR